MLKGTFLEGVAWFWKFKCEHRLLMFQVEEAIAKAGEQKLVSRKEREGLQGEEEREPEPTPAYPGLELSVQARLAELLHRAEDIWCGGGPQFRPSDWCGPRTMCQLLLAAALHLKLFGHSAPRLLRLVARLGREHGGCEEEVLVALAELAAAGAEGEVEAAPEPVEPELPARDPLEVGDIEQSVGHCGASLLELETKAISEGS